ncbi:cutinase family protein [Amycolatopsis taiwanensis]|uniref:cutinase family protein n=1 Tax=Amycolatopsis taiwanensis TaxID=342230 RepID=UPI0004841E68|nr:cutinase family protein [Amycolatopsis taiwanensis]
MRLAAVVRPSIFRLVSYASIVSAFLMASSSVTTSGGRANAAPDCSRPLVVGVHGVGEGPDEYGSGNPSAPLNDTIKRLRKLQTARKSPEAEALFLRYPTISAHTLADLGFWGNGSFFAAVKNASRGLDREVSRARKACPDRRIALVGYSLGAWIIDDYLAGQDTAAQQRAISAVVLYGDPEWPIPSPGGLAREFGHVHISPYKPQWLRERFLSMCLPHDVVCNAGHDTAGARVQQLAACVAGLPGCAHRRYQLDGVTRRGAQALFGWTGGGGPQK